MIHLYTDGSSNGQSGSPTGWAWALVKDHAVITHCMGVETKGTNNTAEMTAAIEGLCSIIQLGHKDVCLVTDSQYVIGIATDTYVPTKNLDLCRALRTVFLASGAKIKWVKGHSGNAYNQYVDKLAKMARGLLEPEFTKPKKTSKKKQNKALKKKAALAKED